MNLPRGKFPGFFNKPLTLYRYWETIFYFKWQKQSSLSSFIGLLQDGACTILFANLSVNRLKGDLSNDTTFNPPLFSLVYTFNYISHDKFFERQAFVLLISYSLGICIVQRSVWTASSLGGIWVSAGSIITDVLRLKPWRMWIPHGRFKHLILKPWRMMIPHGRFKHLRLKPWRMMIPHGRLKLLRLKPWRMWIPRGRFKLLMLNPWRMWIPYGSFKLLRLKPYRMWIPRGRFKLLRLKPRKMWLSITFTVH